VPRKRASVVDFDPGAPAPLEFRWCDVTQRRVAPLSVVVPDVLDDRLSCLLSGLEVRVVHALDCVFQAIVDSRFSRTWTAFQMNVDAVSG
jgi:hypothetical protein